MHLILTGATGHVGSGILAYILSLPADRIERLTIISRRPVPMADGYPHAEVILHRDFERYSEQLLSDLKNADGVIWALGISQFQVNRKEYELITKKFPLAAANAFSTLSQKLNFVYISAEGTTLNPTRLTPTFSRIKGETESALLKLGEAAHSLNAVCVRLGFIDHAHNPRALQYAKATRQRVWLRVIDSILTPAVRRLWPNMHTPTMELGKVVTDLAMGEAAGLHGPGVEGDGILRNFGFRRLAGLRYSS